MIPLEKINDVLHRGQIKNIKYYLEDLMILLSDATELIQEFKNILDPEGFELKSVTTPEQSEMVDKIMRKLKEFNNIETRRLNEK